MREKSFSHHRKSVYSFNVKKIMQNRQTCALVVKDGIFKHRAKEERASTCLQKWPSFPIIMKEANQAVAKMIKLQRKCNPFSGRYEKS